MGVEYVFSMPFRLVVNQVSRVYQSVQSKTNLIKGLGSVCTELHTPVRSCDTSPLIYSPCYLSFDIKY